MMDTNILVINVASFEANVKSVNKNISQHSVSGKRVPLGKRYRINSTSPSMPCIFEYSLQNRISLNVGGPRVNNHYPMLMKIHEDSKPHSIGGFVQGWDMTFFNTEFYCIDM